MDQTLTRPKKESTLGSEDCARANPTAGSRSAHNGSDHETPTRRTRAAGGPAYSTKKAGVRDSESAAAVGAERVEIAGTTAPRSCHPVGGLVASERDARRAAGALV